MLQNILQRVDQLHEGLVKGSIGCRDECSSMLLGVLIREMDKHKLDQHQRLESCSGRSLRQVISLLLSFETPTWYVYNEYHEGTSKHTCEIQNELKRVVLAVLNEIKGLELCDYRVQ